MPLDESKDNLERKYGIHSLEMKEFPKRLERVRRTGCSFHNTTLDELLAGNRAGDNEKELSKQEILVKYCLENLNNNFYNLMKILVFF